MHNGQSTGLNQPVPKC